MPQNVAVATFGYGRLDPYMAAQKAVVKVVNLKVSTTYAAGTVLGEITASPGTFGPYASGNVDGTQNPVGILKYQCVTDASGNVTLGAGPAGTSEWGLTSKGAELYIAGIFKSDDLTGLDANAVAKLGRLVQGTTSSGVFELYGA